MARAVVMSWQEIDAAALVGVIKVEDPISDPTISRTAASAFLAFALRLIWLCSRTDKSAPRQTRVVLFFLFVTVNCSSVDSARARTCNEYPWLGMGWYEPHYKRRMGLDGLAETLARAYFSPSPYYRLRRAGQVLPVSQLAIICWTSSENRL